MSEMASADPKKSCMMFLSDLPEHLESMEYDVVIVGAGPAGLSAAIRLKQLAKEQNQEIKVCILEKGASVGAHILSGAVMEPRSLEELLPNWRELGAPLKTPVIADYFYYLSSKRAWRFPTPRPFKNNGNYIISLGEVCRFLGEIAQSLGVEIYPGFTGSSLLYDDNDRVIGIVTGAFGIDKVGKHTPQYQAGMVLRSRLVLLAEGCRGSLSEKVIAHHQLRTQQPQTYGLGIKELWRVDNAHYKPGTVIHTIGWPLPSDVYGGSFIYHHAEWLAIGLIVGLDYENPYLNPYDEFQRFKTHPFIKSFLKGGERIAYGARALVEGGWQSLPHLNFPGGLLIGDSAGFLNVAKIKGSHAAMKSGMLAAEASLHALSQEQHPLTTDYPVRFQESWLAKELYAVRNIRPGFNYGLWGGLINAAFETYLSYGHSPWTLSQHNDYKTLKKAKHFKPIVYPKPDGILTFDRLSSVYLSNTYHNENQPNHLYLKDAKKAITINYIEYASPETRYCPAGVYEIVYNEDKAPYLQINAQNCVHCKTCDIKDPTQNIEWKVPEGGGGPNYSNM